MGKKIAYCIPSLYIAGGMERVLTLKANYLADQAGHEVYIILTDGKDKAPWFPLSSRIKIIHLDLNFDSLWHLPLWKKGWVYLKKQRLYKKRLTRCLQELKPDITVSMMRREINFINTIRDGSRKIGEIHVNRKNYRNFNDASQNPVKRILQKVWMNQMLRKVKQLDKFIVLCNEDKAQYPELSNVCAIPNPLSFFPEHITSTPSRQVLAVGRYEPQKGFDLLLKAWQQVQQQHPDYTLAIYGAGDPTPYIRQAQELNIEDSCRFYAPVDDIAEKYMESELFVLSSRFEGFGMVITEAMSCGVPSVSFACPCGPRDIIDDGRDGFLVENGNTDRLAEKICFLIEHPELRHRMGKQARINARRFQLENIMQQWERLFDEVLKNHPSSPKPESTKKQENRH